MTHIYSHGHLQLIKHHVKILSGPILAQFCILWTAMYMKDV